MWLMIVTVAEVSLSMHWKNKIAVLVGDYLLSKGLLLSIDHSDFDLLHILSLYAK
jgi:octaprenyl-diphosphate synthase